MNPDLTKPEASDLCIICKVVVADNSVALVCDKCQGWNHAKCLGYSAQIYKFLSNNKEPWFCVGCKTKFIQQDEGLDIKFGKLMEGFDHLKGEMHELVCKTENSFEKMGSIYELIKLHEIKFDRIDCELIQISKNCKAIDDLKIQINSLQFGIDSLNLTGASVTHDALEGMPMYGLDKAGLSDFIENKIGENYRQRSLLILGLGVDIFMSQTNIENLLVKMFGLFDIFYDRNSFVLEIIDLKGKNKMLKLTFSSLNLKWKFYKCYVRLKDAKDKDFKGVYISLDRSKEERILYNELRKQVKERNALGERLTIYKNTIVQRLDGADVRE